MSSAITGASYGAILEGQEPSSVGQVELKCDEA
jgi:hypothetical protein